MNHVRSETPERQAWYSDSAVQREARPSEAACGRGGVVSQPNSVTPNCTGCVESTRCSRTPALSTERILGRSPSSTFPGAFALPKAPPQVYGWCDQTSNLILSSHVVCGCAPFETQSSERIQGSG